MKISARNVYQGTVTHVQAGAINDEVGVDIGAGNRLVAVVTHGSALSLGLDAGRPVTAIIKASSVLVMTDSGGVRLSARNLLAGKVGAVTEGPVGAAVTIDLAGGAQVHATITREAVAELGLRPGVAATAVVKASSILLGVRP